MSSSLWNVVEGDQFFLWNVKTGLFLGQPEVRWAATLSRVAHLIPTVSDVKQCQVFTLRKEHPEQEKTVTTQSTFHLYAGDLQMSTNLYGASEIWDAPPQPVTLETGQGDQVNVHTRWMFQPSSPEQISRSDQVLHYGMPIYLLKLNARRYLRLSLNHALAAVERVPIVNQEMDPWMMIPASSIHVCVAPKEQQCHSLSGTGVTQAMMRCTYTDKGIVCRDDEGHLIYRGLDDCQEQCQVPSYQCSGPPLFQCHLGRAPPHQPWQSFDECVQSCGSPRITVDNPLPLSSPPVVQESKKSHWGFWVMIGVALMATLTVLIYAKKTVRSQ